MQNLKSGDRIELFYEEDPETTISAQVDRVVSGWSELISRECEDYLVSWIEITVDEPGNMDAKQVVLLNTDFQYRYNGRQVILRKC